MLIIIKKLFSCFALPPPVSLAGVFLLALATAGQACAADDVTARAMKLYEKHHFEDAARLLRPELAKMESGKQAAASLALGMSYLGSSAVYRDLYQTALLIEFDYLAQLRRQRTGATSRAVDFYLGQVLLESGRPADAITHLRRYTRNVEAKSVLKVFGDIELGIAYARMKQQKNAEQIWAGVDLNKPELKAALAGAHALIGAQQQNPVAMADAALREARVLRITPDSRMLRNLLRAYTHGGASENALALLAEFELKNASYIENLGASKAINFYDTSVLQDMAQTHLHAAVKHLEQARLDAKLSPSANYYLADAYLHQGKTELAMRADASFLAQTRIPEQYRNNARIHQAGAQYMAGQHKQAGLTWQSMAETSAQDPVLLSAIMMACTEAGADCSKLEKLALAAIEKGEGKKFFPLNAALGKYYLQQKKFSRAESYMEAGRDKAHKNKIEVNNPGLLIGLAEVYYRNKKFSESLEIYFELSNQYPAVRQIQDAMQGIYSMEQKSAGDVKIF